MQDERRRPIPTIRHEIEALAENHFGISGKASELPGDTDLNFKIETVSSTRYLLKLTRQAAKGEELDFQRALLETLTDSFSFHLPKLIRTSNNEVGCDVMVNDNSYYLRMLTWVPGRVWAKVHPKTSGLRYALGQKAGALTQALQTLRHPYAERSFPWNLAESLWTQEHLGLFSGEQWHQVHYFQQRFEESQSSYQRLRKSVIHNDLNDYNILVAEDLAEPKVSGFIDFGDAVFAQCINDLAILLAYACMDLPDPLSAAYEVVKGYHQEFPLQAAELDVLYILVGMRLVTTVTQAALRKVKEPNNTYLTISEGPAWDLLKKWQQIPSSLALATFRGACGFEPCPRRTAFEQWAAKNQIPLNTLFPTLSISGTHPVDMSLSSPWLGLKEDYLSNEITQFKLDELQREYPDHLLTNGYGEIRPFYITDAFKKEGNQGPEYRTVHLGTDFWVAADTPLHAPFSGTVVLLEHNELHKDYGNVIILKHEMEAIVFYSLYGHLSASIHQHLKIGQELQQGELLGYIGNPKENGDWAPHLHFQLILDLLGNQTNFPGVAFPAQKEIFCSLCPDPDLIFKEPIPAYTPQHYKEQLQEKRHKVLGSSLSLSYDEPLYMVRGEGAYLINETGRKYLDTVNNVAHVGHEHPKVVRAAQGQMAVLNTNTRYLHPAILDFADALLQKLPKELEVLYLVNSGSEATELALRMAKTYSAGDQIIALETGYHGNTNASIDVSSYKFDGKGGQGKPKDTHLLPLPDPFRGKYRGANSAGEYAASLDSVLNEMEYRGLKPAALIAESILSCGGQIVPPPNYFKSLYQGVRAAGGLCIADEVQTGLGRVGSHFWAFQLHEVIPDIVTLGKPIGNGHPLAAVACTRAVAEAFSNGMEFFNTFGGNPVSCTIGKAVLEVIEEENLQQQAAQVGAYLKSGLKRLQQNYPILADVRGHGLFLGIELTTEDLNPLPLQASYLVNRMRELGILMSTDGPDHNVIKIKPPLVFTTSQADELLDRLASVLTEDYMRIY
ncbi:aminotransferase class III-fold pyridoxal phosphate-dependent enzyme [Croceiramulus getboli]|nr:aminotransferase class III-fold pyridoxal phosphate-dependent enzyme [Flavobacteriaceae bacterium YJPT1-3]